MPDLPSTGRPSRGLAHVVAVAVLVMVMVMVGTGTKVAAAANQPPTSAASPAPPASAASPAPPATGQPAATAPAYPPPPPATAPYAYPPPPYAYPPPGAYPPPRQWAARPPPGPERGIAAAQIGLGSLTMLASLVAMGLILESTNGSGEVASVFILAAPAITGFVVCNIGGRSYYYQGNCASSVVGAYVGLLAAVPAAFVGCQIAGNSSNDCFEGAALGLLVGMLVGPAVGGAVGWHMYKLPRLEYGHDDGLPPTAMQDRKDRPPPPRSMALLDDSSAGRRGSRQEATGHAQLTVPLLSLAFR